MLFYYAKMRSKFLHFTQFVHYSEKAYYEKAPTSPTHIFHMDCLTFYHPSCIKVLSLRKETLEVCAF